MENQKRKFAAIVFTDIVPSASILKVSSSASGDNSQTLTITGRDSSGTIITDALSLNGTSTVVGTKSFERILKMVTTSHTGTLTIIDSEGSPNTVATMEPAITTVRRPFYNVSADVSGGSDRDYYEKVFLKNNNSTNALLNASLVEASDGTEAVLADVTFDLESSQNGSNTSTNRVTPPAGGGMLGSPTFDDSSKSIPTTSLGPSSGIGVWLKLNLPDGTVATNTTFTLRASGSTT